MNDLMEYLYVIYNEYIDPQFALLLTHSILDLIDVNAVYV